MLLFQCCVFAILCSVSAHISPKLNKYKVKKIDVSDPSCKYVISELVGIDRKLFNISSFFPWLQKIADNYKNPAKIYRKKRDMAFLVDMLNSGAVNAILDSLGRILKMASPCLSYSRDYLKFWVHDVSGRIIKDQWNRFFELE
ncbi:hypothetical protein HUJ04_007889 [Dendroctonus ponderosae]